MDPLIEKALASLHSRHINGIFAENAEDARRKILNLIPIDAVVGIGDSTSMRQIGLLKALDATNLKVLNPFESRELRSPEEALRYHKKTLREATVCDVFVTGTNAITLDGKLVSADAVGNRVAGMFWGHPTSIIVVGRNKIVNDLDEALTRLRKVIAPTHVHIRSVELKGGNSKTPCAVTGECSDCRSRDRICNIFSIIEGKPFFTDLHVVIVDEDLGLGWDPSWPKERITRIMENYKKLVWIPVRHET
jgi:L-lactate utilization protein LutB